MVEPCGGAGAKRAAAARGEGGVTSGAPVLAGVFAFLYAIILSDKRLFLLQFQPSTMQPLCCIMNLMKGKDLIKVLRQTDIKG